jgi:hypothetical protein
MFIGEGLTIRQLVCGLVVHHFQYSLDFTLFYLN